MLPKTKRLNRELFSHIFKTGRAIHSEHFILRFSPDKGGKWRVGASVSKKVSKKAVTRNTVRRRIYSSIGKLGNRMRNSDYVIIAKSGADKIKGDKLDQELAELFKKS